MRDIVLASGSARRRELLIALVSEFAVQPPDVPEPLSGDARADALALAEAKAIEIARRSPAAIVIGADTLVFDEMRTYGKPTDHDDARAMLARLQGRWHSVSTAVAAVFRGRLVSEISESRVKLHALTYAAIEGYVESGRPLDKAGAYAIQDEDVPTVDELDGCYCSVMGLPLWRLRSILAGQGLNVRSPDALFARCAACPERDSRRE